MNKLDPLAARICELNQTYNNEIVKIKAKYKVEVDQIHRETFYKKEEAAKNNKSCYDHLSSTLPFLKDEAKENFDKSLESEYEKNRE